MYIYIFVFHFKGRGGGEEVVERFFVSVILVSTSIELSIPCILTRSVVAWVLQFFSCSVAGERGG